jgi:hypothetical protein
VYNIGNNNPVKLMDFITAIENKLGKNIQKNFLPLQAGDVPATYADVSDLVEDSPIFGLTGANTIDANSMLAKKKYIPVTENSAHPSITTGSPSSAPVAVGAATVSRFLCSWISAADTRRLDTATGTAPEVFIVTTVPFGGIKTRRRKVLLICGAARRDEAKNFY